jgi:dTDP-4-dehydrorhamnose 3,5-epimerase-like enzyme
VTTIDDCRLIDLPQVHDVRGNLTYIEGGRHVGFDVKRVFYLYDVPGGATRAGHAQRTCHQFIIAMSGSFDVILDDGERRRRQQLNRSYQGLYIPPRIWRELENFSSGSVCLVLASDVFNEADYCRDYTEFRPSEGGS